MKKLDLLALLKKVDHQAFFPFMPQAVAQNYYISRQDGVYDFDLDSLSNSPETVQKYFRHCAQVWQRKKFHYFYPEGCTIEPFIGWAINQNEELIPQSMWSNYIDDIKPSYIRYKLERRNKVKLDTAISIHYAWKNYWHFYNDVLGQLRLADEAGLSKDIPVVIPAGLAKLSFFKEIVSMSPDLQKRNWFLQDNNTNIYCQNAHFFNTYWSDVENFNGVLDYIDFKKKLKKSTIDKNRIFINRKRDRGRNIKNIEEIIVIVKKFKFDIIDCDDLSVLEQIDVFQRSEYVIGIHGAGLTNIVYRQGKPMKLLEIFSRDFLNPTYFWLTQQCGFSYYSILGGSSNDTKNPNGNFELDAREFEKQLETMFSE